MKLDGRQILFSLFIVLLVNCWVSTAFHATLGNAGKKTGKRAQEAVGTQAQFQDLCQEAKEQCDSFNFNVMRGSNKKQREDEENPSQDKKASFDVIITVKSLCNLLKQQCEPTMDTARDVKRMSRRSLWQQD